MNYSRFLYKNVETCGYWKADRLYRIDGDFMDQSHTLTDEEINCEQITYLPLIQNPSKIVCVGWNYLKHTQEDNKLPTEPPLFLKAPSALNAHQGKLVFPKNTHRLGVECEIAVVIGQECKNVPEENVKDIILGYTIMNDATARCVLERQKIFAQAKGYDSFAPLGPVLSTNFDYKNKKIQIHINGEIQQDGSTNDMIFNIEQLVSRISEIYTLKRGDIISTGTPISMNTDVNIGDQIILSVEGLVSQSIEVVAE